MYSLSPRGEANLKNEEGLRLYAYVCAAGKLTIGYGHRILDNEPRSITKDQAEAYFRLDTQRVLAELWKERTDLTQNEVDAIVSFIYNIGINAWRGSHAIRVSDNVADLSKEMGRWVHDDHGNVIPGLVLRRHREINILRGAA